MEGVDTSVSAGIYFVGNPLWLLYLFLTQYITFFLDYSYSIVLRHTTEEVLAACLEAIEPARAALTSHLRNQVMNDLMVGLKTHSWFKGFDISDEPPIKYSVEQWIKLAKEVQATVFIAGSVPIFYFLMIGIYIQFSVSVPIDPQFYVICVFYIFDITGLQLRMNFF